MPSRRLFTLAICLCFLGFGDSSANFSTVLGDEFRFCHENVLGTSLEIRLEAASPELAAKMEARVLGEIERLDHIFSTYKTDSELSRFNQLAVGDSMLLSQDLARLLKESQDWQAKTNSAFHPGAESLCELWKAGARKNQIPHGDDLVRTVEAISKPAWEIDSQARATKLANYRVGLNAIAEGYILDRVYDLLQKEFAPQSLLINLGGEIRCSGKSFPTAIRNPLATARNAKPLDVIDLHNEAIATSGGYHRFHEIEGQRHSHLIDPRTGQPVAHLLSCTVVAAEATTADVLATALSVLSVSESLTLADSLDGIAVLLVDAEGRSWANRTWTKRIGATPAPLEVASDSTLTTAVRDGDKELVVNLEINQPGGGNRYRRPYIAVWVEDKDGYPVKTLALWVQSSDPGPRWIPDLKKWYKADGLRKLAEDVDLVASMSEATHKPGKYELTWDGKDTAGKPVEEGEYTLYIEAAREHGTYQLIKQAIKLGGEDFEHKPKGNVEIKAAEILYHTGKNRQ